MTGWQLYLWGMKSMLKDNLSTDFYVFSMFRAYDACKALAGNKDILFAYGQNEPVKKGNLIGFPEHYHEDWFKTLLMGSDLSAEM